MASYTLVMPLAVRYYEADQQGVVFNMWYLAYFEEGRNAYFEAVGYPLTALLASGHDIQVVASHIVWQGPVRWGDEHVELTAHVSRVGETSLTFEFEIRRDGQTLVTGQTVYVIVDRGDGGKRPVPDSMRSAINGTST